MKRDIIVVLLVIASTISISTIASETIPKTYSFSTAKKKAMEVTADHRETLYCSCGYDSGGGLLDQGCGYVPRNMFNKDGNVNPRTARIDNV